MEKISTKNKIIKFISTLLIISIITPTILFSRPKQAEADPGGVPIFDSILESAAGVTATETTIDTGYTIKKWAEYIGQQLLKMIAKQLLAKMTQATINWINSDFHGAPLFLENPDSFFGDIVKSELKNVVNTFGFDRLTFPFGKQFALNTINSYKRQLSGNMGYTLRGVMNSAQAENYRNNFNVGGWNGFLINTQYPQNNYLGSQMQMNDYLARQIQGASQNAAQKVQSALQQGMGFLSPQTCPSNPSYNNGVNEFQKPSFQYSAPNTCDDQPMEDDEYNACQDAWTTGRNAAKASWATTNTCPGGLVNTTPGSVAASQIFTAVGTPFLQTALDGAIGNSLAAIFDALLTHFLNKGLNALSSVVRGTPPADNWSYNGNTLDGNTTTAGALTIPQNVSVTVGKTTSTTISGGKGSYSIQSPSNASIAIATIDMSSSSGAKLTIIGVAPGTTSIVIQDSSNPAQTVTVTITVNAVGAIVVIPANISTTADANNQVMATISGGAEPYSIQTGPNQTIAIAILSSPNLIVTGITNGSTFIDLKDSSTPAKTVRVNILVGPNVLTITPPNISVNVGQETNLSISNGTMPYIVTSQQNITMAYAEIRPTTPTFLTVTGYAPGTSTVTITDSSSPAKTGTINITTVP